MNLAKILMITGALAVVFATGLTGCAEGTQRTNDAITSSTTNAVLQPSSSIPPVDGKSQLQAEQAKVNNSCPFFSKKMLGGSLIGAAVGGGTAALIKGRLSLPAILIGAGAGALTGAAVGKALDVGDCEAAKVAMQKIGAAPVGTQVAWANPTSGNRGTDTVTSEATVDATNGKLCRKYHQTVMLKTQSQPIQQDGITCREDNGDWQTIS